MILTPARHLVVSGLIYDVRFPEDRSLLCLCIHVSGVIFEKANVQSEVGRMRSQHRVVYMEKPYELPQLGNGSTTKDLVPPAASTTALGANATDTIIGRKTFHVVGPVTVVVPDSAFGEGDVPWIPVCVAATSMTSGERHIVRVPMSMAAPHAASGKGDIARIPVSMATADLTIREGNSLCSHLTGGSAASILPMGVAASRTAFWDGNSLGRQMAGSPAASILPVGVAAGSAP